MSTLLVSECLADEDVRADLVPELSAVVHEDKLRKSGISLDVYRGKIASVLMQVGLCGEDEEESIPGVFQGDDGSMGVSRSGAVIRTIAGSLHEGEYAGDEEIPTIPPAEIVNCKFDPDPLGECVVPEAILPSIVEWKENDVIGDLIGEELLADLVRQAKSEELSEMYRRPVWTEVPVYESIEKTGRPPILVRWVITNKGDSNNYNVRARLVAKHIVAKYGGKVCTNPSQRCRLSRCSSCYWCVLLLI